MLSTSDDAQKALADWKNKDRLIVVKGLVGREITKIDTRLRTTDQRLRLKDEEILRFEEDNNIAERWVPGSPQYISATKLLAERKYRQAIDTLERLVVQRLFELTKLGMNGVGTYTALLNSLFSMYNISLYCPVFRL